MGDWQILRTLYQYVQQLDSKDFNLFGGGIKFHSHMRGVQIMAEFM